MAKLLDFQKIREDSKEVEYIFGYPEMNRHLVVQKASKEGTPLDGSRDPDFAAVFVKIRRYYTNLETWPEKGSYAA